jgi:L-ascorbate metabolism protein UlaG (beta-lactamase superfamily)
MDHLDASTLAALAAASPSAKFVVPVPIVRDVAGAGLDHERILGTQPGASISFGDVTVHPVAALHGVNVSDAYSFGQEMSGGLYRYLGFVIEGGGVCIYHAADTLVYDGLAETLRRMAVDVALLPINGRDYFREARNFVGNMNYREAAQLAVDAEVDMLIPTHYDMFPDNLGYPAHLVDIVQRHHASVSVLVLSRERPVVYTAWRTDDGQ